MFLKVILLISATSPFICAKNILFINLVPSRSHHIWNEALIEGLLSREHNITMIGFYPTDIKSSRYFILEIDVAPFLNSVDNVLKDITESTSVKSILSMWTFIKKACDYNLRSKQFEILMEYPKDFFDLLAFDVTFSECYLPLIDHFGNPPSIVVTPFGMQTYLNDVMGERIENYIPYYAFKYTDKMSFFERIRNIFYVTIERVSRWYYLKELDEANKNIFGEKVRSIQELEREISLMFPNEDPVLDYPKPYSPNIIPIGGIHVKTPKKLDENLQKLLDESKSGVIFASMGSNFQPKNYEDHAAKAFVAAFERLNVTVLWKFDDVKVSKNVVVKKWFPQSEILAHPNTKLFVTHCGVLSSQETIVRGVPIIGVPLFHDQFYRAEKLKAIKGGIILDYWELNPDDLFDAIVAVLNNPEYKENVLKLSSKYKEQPQKPLEKFLVWTDYLLKSGHLDHLSIAAREMTWYQIDNWDILGLSTILMAFLLILFKYLYNCAIQIFFKNNEKQKVQ